MPVGRIECPPSASLPRDCNHECRVCRVTVVGLSTYAKHISSQLHKDNVEALEKEEEKEEAEEEYFDKELVQLINKRKEQSRQEETRYSSKDDEADNYQRRREDRLPFQETGQQEWLRDPSDRSWQWQNDCFSKSRQSFIHPALNHKSNRHLSNPNGRSGWHINNPSNRHLIHVNVGGTWHSNAGGATSWHQRSTSRNFHWPQEGSENFSNQHPRNCGGNRQSNSYNGNQWKFGNTNAFPQGRNRPSRHSDTVQENDPRWNTKNCASSSFCKERFKWKNVDSKTSSSTPIPNSSAKPSNNTESSSSSKVDSSKNKNSLPNSNVTPSKATEDFTSNKHIADKFLAFKRSENLDVSSKTKPTQCSEKSINPLREKPHRWSPYPSQKVSEIQQTTPQSVDKDLADQSDKTKETESGDPKKDQILGDKNVPEFSPEPSDGKKTHHSESTCYRMPSLKSPLCNISDVKVLTLKRDQKNPLKGVKLNSSATFGERQNRLSALNLETIRSNSYISKLRSASKKTNQEPQDGGKKEPVETLSEVLRKAKEMLRSSQAIQSPYVQSLSNSPNHDNSTRSEASNNSLQTGISFDDTLEDVSDDDFFCSEEKMATAEESNGCYTNQERVEGLKTTENTPSITSFVQFTDTAANSQSNSESLDCENDHNSHPCQDYHDTDTLENVAEGATHLTNTILPELSKLGLPVSLQRDLTRHISSRSKTGSHLPEPNLNSARRIRNVSGHRKSETDKDSGLKPTLRQILNASRRNINWEQVIQHVTKKKQELGKGLPRFGIEMVAQVQSEQEGLDFDEESDLGIESYHWEAITASPLGSSRKRSLSESSVIVEKASVFDIINNHSTESSCGGQNSTTLHITQAASGQEVSSSNVKHPKGQKEERGLLVRSSSAADMTDLSNPAFSETSQSQRSNVDTCAASGSLRMCQSASEVVVLSAAQCIEANNADGATDSCTSSTEQYDGPGVGKKRRATGDGSCPEASNLERNNKRRRLRGRKERSQVDQLLNISIREEELSNSLQGVDSSLLQARASLQAAYMEVQRLMVFKQQITMEMSAMRTQRIQILQGLQETYEPTNDGKEGSNSELQTPVLSPGNVFPFFLETPAFRLSPHPESDSPILPPSVPVCTSPAVPAVPDSSIMIKQEPLSPIIVEDNVIEPQLLPLSPSAQAQSSPPPQTNGEHDQNTSSLYPIITATMSLAELTSKFPAVNKTSVSVATSPQVYGSQKTDSDSTENRRAPVQSPQQGQILTTNISTQETTCSTGPAENGESTLITIETKSGKKKKKLRKKKTLRAAHIPENSDTEQDIDSKPVRKVKCRRLSKDTTVSTSTSLEQEGDTVSQEAELNRVGNYSDSNIEVMEIKNPRFEVVEIDSHSDDEKPDSPSKNDLADFVCSSQGHIETHDEVTSTSELGTNYSEEILRKAKTRRDSSNAVKISAEVSSEPGEEDQPTEGSFDGHQASVNALQIFDGTLYTCSADKSVRAYNLVTRKCEGVFEGHTSKVNCLLVTQPHGRNAMLYTGSSDHTVRCFSIKSRECIGTLELEERVLCLHVRWKILYVGLANGTVVTFSIKNNKPIDVFECHGPRAVSCLATAQEGARRLLLVGSYDCTISVRDANNGLLLRTLEGHTKTVLCMKVVNDLVFSGSSDQSVHAHNIHTGELVRIYKGHNHAVTVVNILGKVMVTACLDKFVRVYELQSHDRLQVYGGHSDMIMCMTIHKSMIYTGCYDGSVQAVRLNLIQNYRCWWHGCSLNFGVAEHLKQHLLTDHTNPNFQTLKCRWKNCDAFFTARRGSKQDAIGHIERHAQEDSLINM